MIYTGTFDVLEDTETSVEGKDDDNGPWVSFFFISVVFFFVLNDIYRFYGRSKGTEGSSGGNDDDNGPKRRETRRLGPR